MLFCRAARTGIGLRESHRNPSSPAQKKTASALPAKEWGFQTTTAVFGVFLGVRTREWIACIGFIETWIRYFWVIDFKSPQPGVLRWWRSNGHISDRTGQWVSVVYNIDRRTKRNFAACLQRRSSHGIFFYRPIFPSYCC